MRILFLDTETTDLPDRRLPPGRGQPHVVQLAAVLTDGKEERAVATLIRPDGWRIHPKAQATHGISLERAEAEGVPIAEAIAAFDELLTAADLAVAHNLPFDRLLIDSEYLRLDRRAAWPRTFCTMAACTDILCIPGYHGQYKYASLDESHRHLLGRAHAGAHDAVADVRACMAIYAELTRRGLTPGGNL